MTKEDAYSYERTLPCQLRLGSEERHLLNGLMTLFWAGNLGIYVWIRTIEGPDICVRARITWRELEPILDHHRAMKRGDARRRRRGA